MCNARWNKIITIIIIIIITIIIIIIIIIIIRNEASHSNNLCECPWN